MNCVKTAEPIAGPFVEQTHLVPWNVVLDGGPVSPWTGNCEGEGAFASPL